MTPLCTLLFLALSTTTTSSASATYLLSTSFQGPDFFDAGWNWETFDDPTHGRVNYVNKDTAINKKLAYAEADKFFMRADRSNPVPPKERGRDSIRITSNFAFDDAILVLDVTHMPEGCGTWPAWWTLSKNGPWPNGGEIDIIEGVNLDETNLASLHTSSGCTMPANRRQKGRDVSLNCDAAFSFNQGCGARFTNTKSYGASFNANGGGFFALQKTGEYIKVWFWPRNENVPNEIRNVDGGNISPNESWGDPEAYFPSDSNSCDFKSHFNEHVTVFDLTFCGDWAGSAWAQSDCPRITGASSCEDFVNNHPNSFENAYWEINGLRVYRPFSGPKPILPLK